MAKSQPRQLSDKQRMFVAEYLVDLNATQAAIRAGYSEKTAVKIGCENLTKPDIQAAVQEAMSQRAEKTGITAERVLEEIAHMAFANLQDFYDTNGSLKDIHTLPRNVAAALSSARVNLTEACAVQEVKLHDKKGSLELLGKHLKLFTDKHEVDMTGNVTLVMSKEDAAL